jgi:hypothetical protein
MWLSSARPMKRQPQANADNIYILPKSEESKRMLVSV